MQKYADIIKEKNQTNYDKYSSFQKDSDFAVKVSVLSIMMNGEYTLPIVFEKFEYIT